MTDPAGLVEAWREAARAASTRAYSPYSRFRVGAVALGSDGRAWSGCNVENASYGLTQCAERNALAHAIADGAEPGSLHHLVVYTDGRKVLPPCGACRQVMVELMAGDALVVACCDTDEWLSWRVRDLMPSPFLP